MTMLNVQVVKDHREQYPNCNKNVLQKRYKVSNQSLTWINCIESTIYFGRKSFWERKCNFSWIIKDKKKKNVYLKVTIFHFCIIKNFIQFAIQTCILLSWLSEKTLKKYFSMSQGVNFGKVRDEFNLKIKFSGFMLLTW